MAVPPPLHQQLQNHHFPQSICSVVHSFCDWKHVIRGSRAARTAGGGIVSSYSWWFIEWLRLSHIAIVISSSAGWRPYAIALIDGGRRRRRLANIHWIEEGIEIRSAVVAVTASLRFGRGHFENIVIWRGCTSIERLVAVTTTTVVIGGCIASNFDPSFLAEETKGV